MHVQKLYNVNITLYIISNISLRMLYIIFICFVTVLCSARDIEGIKTPEEIFKQFCESLNLRVGVSDDCDSSTVAVFFQLINSEHRGCFNFFDIYLTREKKTVAVSRVEYDDEKGRATHIFENVTSGVYEIYIKPFCTLKMCPNMQIDYEPLINMSGKFCTEKKIDEKNVKENQKQELEKMTVIIIAVGSALLLLIISGSIYLAGRIKRHMGRIPNFTDKDTEADKNTAIGIEVYIFHYYDKNEKIKKKVEIVKDFLLKSSHFSCVKGIEDDLAVILFDVNYWLNDVLEERGKDGAVRRIILITSQGENEPKEDDEIENQIFTAFIKKLNNNFERCLTGYDNLFVVQLDDTVTHSEKFKNVVRRDRYSLYGELMVDHMTDLCLNLCSGLKLDMSQVEEKTRELLSNHPVKHLGKHVDLAEYV